MLLCFPPLEPRQRQVRGRSARVTISSTERRNTDQSDGGWHAGAGDVALVGGLGRLLGDGGGLAHGQGVGGDDAGAARKSKGLGILGDDLAGRVRARHDAGLGARAHGDIDGRDLRRSGGLSGLHSGRRGDGGSQDLVAEGDGEDGLDGDLRGDRLVDGGNEI